MARQKGSLNHVKNARSQPGDNVMIKHRWRDVKITLPYPPTIGAKLRDPSVTMRPHPEFHQLPSHLLLQGRSGFTTDT